MEEAPKTFEKFLEEIHADTYTGLDDDMPDAYEKWRGELDTELLIQLAEAYGNRIRKEYEFED